MAWCRPGLRPTPDVASVMVVPLNVGVSQLAPAETVAVNPLSDPAPAFEIDTALEDMPPTATVSLTLLTDGDTPGTATVTARLCGEFVAPADAMLTVAV